MEDAPTDYVLLYKNVENTLIHVINVPPISYLFKIASWGPVLLSTMLLLMGYWGFVVIICYEQLYPAGHTFLACFGVISFTILWIIGCTSFIKAIFCDPGSVPESFIKKCVHKQENEENIGFVAQEGEGEDQEPLVNVQCVPTDSISNEQANTTRTRELEAVREGYIICRRCNKPRPPRSHHCKHCKKCVTRMDHHCPIINNCVGFNNYKYFLLTVIYCFIGCLEVFLIGLYWLTLDIPIQVG